MRFDLLKEHYFFELTRKQGLESGLTLPVAVLTAIGGVVFTLCTTFEYGTDALTLVFVGLVVVVSGSLIASFVFICHALTRHTYELVPAATDLLLYEEELKVYFQSIKKTEEEAQNELDRKLLNSYAKATTNNKTNNDSRAGNMFKANFSLIFAVVGIACCSIPYAIKLKTKSPEPQKIEIVNNKIGGNSLMPDEPNQPSNSDSPSQSDTGQSSESESEPITILEEPCFPDNTFTKTEKPNFPANEFLRDGDQPSNIAVNKK